MQTHQSQPKHKTRAKKRIGRGGRKGTYSGKGIKGQASRAGRKMVPIIRELIKRYPKLKGYRREAMPDNTVVVNVADLEKIQDGEVITPEFLVKKGIVSHIKGKTPTVKILGAGKLTKKLTIEGCAVSATAKAAIEKAGGAVKETITKKQ